MFKHRIVKLYVSILSGLIYDLHYNTKATNIRTRYSEIYCRFNNTPVCSFSLRPGSFTHHAKHGLVNRLQCFGCPPHCYSSYWVLIFTQASYSLAETSSVSLDTRGFFHLTRLTQNICHFKYVIIF